MIVSLTSLTAADASRPVTDRRTILCTEEKLMDKILRLLTLVVELTRLIVMLISK